MRISIRWKIVGGYGVMLLLIAILAWVTLASFTSLRNVQRRVFRDAVPGLIAVDEIVRSYTAQSAAVRGFLIENDRGLLEQYRGEVEIADLWEQRGVDYFESPAERALLEDLREAGDSFQTLVDEKVIPLAAAGRRAQAFRVLSDEGSPAITRIETVGGQLAAAQDRVVAVIESDLRDRANQTVVILVVVAVGTLAIGLVLAFALPRRLAANLSKLVDAARAIGRGDLNQTLEIQSRDEVEELAQRFIEMQSGLERLQQLALQDRELEIAAAIQRNLLQRSVPDIVGIRLVPLQRQANLVGGDWYDVDLTGRTLSVVVGDASGKGIAAALMATVTLSALRAERAGGAGPKRVIEQANRALLEATSRDSFTTCVYATIDATSGEVRWLNMGHPSPFLLRAEPPPGPASETREADPRGYYVEGPRNRALGWFDDPGFAETIATLAPGDRLVFFTDGFLEAKSPSGEVFGEHRFAQAVARFGHLDATSLVSALVEEVDAFAAGKLDDDLTVLIVEFEGAESRQRAAEHPAVSRSEVPPAGIRLD